MYCDYKWEGFLYSANIPDDKRCSKCGDSHIRTKDLSDMTIDTYIGCPPFPEKKPKKTDDVYNRFDYFPYSE